MISITIHKFIVSQTDGKNIILFIVAITESSFIQIRLYNIPNTSNL